MEEGREAGREGEKQGGSQGKREAERQGGRKKDREGGRNKRDTPEALKAEQNSSVIEKLGGFTVDLAILA